MLVMAGLEHPLFSGFLGMTGMFLSLGNLNCVPSRPGACLGLSQEDARAAEEMQLWEDQGCAKPGGSGIVRPRE